MDDYVRNGQIVYEVKRNMKLRILAVGDVVGAPGLAFLTENLKAIKAERQIDFAVVNGENANVVGITPKQADQIFAAGADVITLGNHTWTRYELQPYLDQRRRILRPANFAPQQRRFTCHSEWFDVQMHTGEWFDIYAVRKHIHIHDG